MATRKRERFIALFFAILFLATSSALAVSVILVNIQSKKQEDPGSTSQQSSASTSQSKDKTMLEGTKLENFTPVDSVPQLQSTDTVAGTGEAVKAGATITFDYTGALAKTGVIFQSSKDTGQPISYPLTSLIKGWQEGIPGMKVGGTRRLLIPSAQGYGSAAQQGIPANSDLVFDITVHAVK